MMRGCERIPRSSQPPGAWRPLPVAQPGGGVRLVLGDPPGHLRRERVVEDGGVIYEPLDGIALQPAASVLQTPVAIPSG